MIGYRQLTPSEVIREGDLWGHREPMYMIPECVHGLPAERAVGNNCWREARTEDRHPGWRLADKGEEPKHMKAVCGPPLSINPEVSPLPYASNMWLMPYPEDPRLSDG